MSYANEAIEETKKKPLYNAHSNQVTTTVVMKFKINSETIVPKITNYTPYNLLIPTRAE